jgi:hypothetical protein
VSAQGIPLQPDFWERAQTNDVQVARLIGFEAKDIADGLAKVVLATGPQHANPRGTLRAEFFATLLTRNGDGNCKYPHAGGVFHYGRTEDQFLSPYLAGRTQSGGNRRTARPHHRVGRVHYDRRGESIGRESGVHLHGASRPEGCRTVIPVSLQRGLQADCLFPPAFPPQRSRSASSKGCNA